MKRVILQDNFRKGSVFLYKKGGHSISSQGTREDNSDRVGSGRSVIALKTEEETRLVYKYTI